MEQILSAADGVPRDPAEVVTWFNQIIRGHPDVLNESAWKYEYDYEYYLENLFSEWSGNNEKTHVVIRY